jgi:hypothetical protein
MNRQGISAVERYRSRADKKDSRRAAKSNNQYVYYVVLALVMLSFALIRLRLVHMPLERDEGEYAYAGQLILQGIPPYKLAYNMKLPGSYAAYALLMALFGQTPFGIHFGLLLVNAATTLLMFFLARRLFGPLAGIVAAAVYALLSTSSSVLGFAGHATHFVVAAAVGGILLLLKALDSGRMDQLFWSGGLLGTAFVMKQPGAFFPLFGGIYLLQQSIRGEQAWKTVFSRAGVYAAGVVCPFALTCLILWRAGVLTQFWFWTFTYARAYGSIVSLSDGWHLLLETGAHVIGPAVLVWLLALAGLSAVAWSATARAQIRFLVEFLLFSFIAICPGLYFRAHYFILLLPAVALLAGVAVSCGKEELARRGKASLGATPAIVFVLACAVAIGMQSDFLFNLSPETAARTIYGGNPFLEAPVIAKYIEDHTRPDAKIAVLGSEPEIYFYAHRRSASPYIYTYELLEEQKFASTMQADMIRDIENARPEYIVYVDVPTSWLVQPHSDTDILTWSANYLQAHYQVVGVADIFRYETQYFWDNDARNYHHRSSASVGLFKRNDF